MLVFNVLYLRLLIMTVVGHMLNIKFFSFLTIFVADLCLTCFSPFYRSSANLKQSFLFGNFSPLVTDRLWMEDMIQREN